MREFFRLFFPIVLLTIAVGVSCNKTDETTTGLYMSGPLTSNVPSHLISGTEFELRATGITLPVDSLTYKWTTKGFNVDSLLGPTGTIIVPDSVGLYDITIRVTHPRYTASQVNKTVIVFNPNSERVSVVLLKEISTSQTVGTDKNIISAALAAQTGLIQTSTGVAKECHTIM
ncbi:MAG TPA: hypothetical protein PKK88_01390 [Bacteroidales bacterium]|nr:hypothetical protein [Bacteroidales bacterium]